MTEPTYTCPKCGFFKVVEKNPESTARWFKKYHKECKAPLIYRAGFNIRYFRDSRSQNS